MPKFIFPPLGDSIKTALKHNYRGGRRRGAPVPVPQPISGSVCLSESWVHLDQDLLSISLGALVSAMLGTPAKLDTSVIMNSICRVNAESQWAMWTRSCLGHPKEPSLISPSPVLSHQFLLPFFFFVGLIQGRSYSHHNNMAVYVCWWNSTIAMGNELLKVIN